jgi:hypothetical protein
LLQEEKIIGVEKRGDGCPKTFINWGNPGFPHTLESRRHKMKRIIFVLSVLFLIILSYSGISIGKLSNDTYLALKKLEAKTQVGISYKDYKVFLGDTKFAVNVFLEGKGARVNPQFSEHIKRAMEFYEKAGEIWDIKMKTIKNPDKYDGIFSDTEPGRLIKTIYPKAKEKIYHDEITLPNIDSMKSNPRNTKWETFKFQTPTYYITEVINEIWKDASRELKKASYLLEQ